MWVGQLRFMREIRFRTCSQVPHNFGRGGVQWGVFWPFQGEFRFTHHIGDSVGKPYRLFLRKVFFTCQLPLDLIRQEECYCGDWHLLLLITHADSLDQRLIMTFWESVSISSGTGTHKLENTTGIWGAEIWAVIFNASHDQETCFLQNIHQYPTSLSLSLSLSLSPPFLPYITLLFTPMLFTLNPMPAYCSKTRRWVEPEATHHSSLRVPHHIQVASTHYVIVRGHSDPRVLGSSCHQLNSKPWHNQRCAKDIHIAS